MRHDGERGEESWRREESKNQRSTKIEEQRIIYTEAKRVLCFMFFHSMTQCLPLYLTCHCHACVLPPPPNQASPYHCLSHAIFFLHFLDCLKGPYREEHGEWEENWLHVPLSTAGCRETVADLRCIRHSESIGAQSEPHHSHKGWAILPCSQEVLPRLRKVEVTESTMDLCVLSMTSSLICMNKVRYTANILIINPS